MARVYIGVGSNIDPESNVAAALRMLSDAAKVAAVSTFYRCPALGSPASPDFYNGVVAIESEIAPREMKFGVLRQIEEALGRVRGPDKNAPRPIDLDILLYGDLVVEEADLVIPDPRIAERVFVAVPLAELEPAIRLPGWDSALAEVSRRMDSSEMTPLPEFTKRLREELGVEPG